MVATADDAAAQLIDLSKSNVVAPVTPPGTPAQDSSSDPMLLGSSGVGLSHVGHMRSAACASSATIGRSSIAWSEYTGFDTVRQLALARESKSGKALATTIALDPDVQVVVLRFEHKSGWCMWLAWKCTPSLSLSLSPLPFTLSLTLTLLLHACRRCRFTMSARKLRLSVIVEPMVQRAQ